MDTALLYSFFQSYILIFSGNCTLLPLRLFLTTPALENITLPAIGAIYPAFFLSIQINHRVPQTVSTAVTRNNGFLAFDLLWIHSTNLSLEAYNHSGDLAFDVISVNHCR